MSDSAERKVQQMLYDAGISPLANAAAAGLPIPLAAAVTQILGAGSVREAYVSAAGVPPKQRSRR
jgi:hypothetical protein